MLLLGDTSQVGLLARVDCVLLNAISVLGEVQLHLVERLALVQTNLNATSAKADSFHVVLIDGGRDDVAGTRHLLELTGIEVLGQVCDVEVDDAWGILHCIVVVQGRFAGYKIVASKHGLLLGLRFSSWHRE